MIAQQGGYGYPSPYPQYGSPYTPPNPQGYGSNQAAAGYQLPQVSQGLAPAANGQPRSDSFTYAANQPPAIGTAPRSDSLSFKPQAEEGGSVWPWLAGAALAAGVGFLEFKSGGGSYVRKLGTHLKQFGQNIKTGWKQVFTKADPPPAS